MASKPVRADTLGEFEQSIMLAVVHLGDDAYGVTIQKEVEARTGRDVVLGALYTTLTRLEDKGFVRSYMSDPTPVRGGRSKRFFSLTREGATALKECRGRLERMWEGLTSDLRRSRP